MILYHIDAETKIDIGAAVKDLHLTTLSIAEAEHAFLKCWFAGQFWSVRIWHEVVQEERAKL